MERGTIGDELFPPPPKQSWWAKIGKWLAGTAVVGSLITGIVMLLLQVAVNRASEGEFVAHAELLPDSRVIAVRLINNSPEVVSVQRLELVVSAEGTVHNGITRTVKITSSHPYSVRLPDVLPGPPAHVPERTGHRVSPGEIDEFEVHLLLAENISVTGTYTVEPILHVHDAAPLRLETVTFPVVTNRVETVPAPDTLAPMTPVVR